MILFHGFIYHSRQLLHSAAPLQILKPSSSLSPPNTSPLLPANPAGRRRLRLRTLPVTVNCCWLPSPATASRRKFGTVAAQRFSFKCSLRKVHMESNRHNEARGALIVLEGLDRSGKTSQSGRLLSYLAGLGYPVESWRFPDRDTSVGQMISSYLSNQSQLDDHTIHLLFSANRWEKRSLMEAKLKSGTSLIVDRYSYSGVAFSAAKGLDIEWCKAPEVGLLAPDLVAYLDIPPEKAAERGGYGGERYEQLEFQKNVAHHYKMLSDASWKMIDACLPMEDVEKQLKEMVLDCVTSCQKGKSISQLWLS